MTSRASFGKISQVKNTVCTFCVLTGNRGPSAGLQQQVYVVHVLMHGVVAVLPCDEVLL